MSTVLALETEFIDWRRFLLAAAQPWPPASKMDLLLTLERCREVDTTLSGRLTQDEFEQVWPFSLRRFKSYDHFVLHNKQCHRKVLLCSFHLNGNTLGFYPRTRMLKPPCIVLNSSISLTKLKARTTLPSVIDNTAWNYCSAVFTWITRSHSFSR